jgi:transposase
VGRTYHHYSVSDETQAADQARANGEKFINPAHRAWLQITYDHWVAIGLKAHPEQHKPPNKQGKSGRVKQSTETNLLRRLRDKREEVLRFMNGLQVSFDNNQAEQDLRMVKVQQKVSGGFRSQAGAEWYCVISGYISKVRKQGLNLIEAIKSAFTGNPIRFITWIVTK